MSQQSATQHQTRLYRNHRLIGRRTPSVGQVSLAQYPEIQIGCTTGHRFFFTGMLSEICLFDHALSAEQKQGVTKYLIDKCPSRAFPEITAAPLHADFRISASGDLVFLTAPNGQTADSVATTTMPRDVSFGRSLAEPNTWTLFHAPTPGVANAGPREHHITLKVG